MTSFFHIPLWKSYRNGETKRLYLRYEFLAGTTWGSCGKNKDGSMKIYRRSIQWTHDLSICHDKVPWPLTYDQY